MRAESVWVSPSLCVCVCVLYALRLNLKVVELYGLKWAKGAGQVKFNYCHVCVCICFARSLSRSSSPSPSLSLSGFAINNCHNWFRQSTQHFTVCCSWQQNFAAACSQRQHLLSSILLHFWPIKETGQIFDLVAPCSVYLKVCQIKVLSKSNKNRQKERTKEWERQSNTLAIRLAVCAFILVAFAGAAHTCSSSSSSSICNQIHKNTNKAKCQQTCRFTYHTIHISNISRIYSCTFRAATNLLLTNQSASSMEYPIKQQRWEGVCGLHVACPYKLKLHIVSAETNRANTFQYKRKRARTEKERETSKSLTFLFKFNCIVYIFISVYLAAVKWLISSGIRY